MELITANFALRILHPAFKNGLSNLNISRIINTNNYYDLDRLSYSCIIYIPHERLTRLSI